MCIGVYMCECMECVMYGCEGCVCVGVCGVCVKVVCVWCMCEGAVCVWLCMCVVWVCMGCVV